MCRTVNEITRSNHISSTNASSNGGTLVYLNRARVFRAGSSILVLLIFTLQMVYRVMNFFVVTSRICIFLDLGLRLKCGANFMSNMSLRLSLVTLTCITFLRLFVFLNLLLILQRIATTMRSLSVIASVINVRSIVLHLRLIYSLLRYRYGVQDVLNFHFQVFLSVNWHEILLSPGFELDFWSFALLLAHILVLHVELLETNSIKSLFFSLTCESLW